MSKFPTTEFAPADIKAGNVNTAIKEAEGKVTSKADAGAAVMLSTGEINTFPDLQVRVMGKAWNERVDALAADMKVRGFDAAKPVIVFALTESAEGKPVQMIYLEDGHTRLAAAAKAGIEAVPAIFRPAGWTPLEATKHMIQDNSGEPLSPWEQSVAVARMKGNGIAEDEIAGILGKTKRYVQDLLVLSTAPVAIRNAVLKGEIAAAVAVREIRASGADKAADKIGKAVEKAKAAGKNKVTPTSLKGKEKATGKKDKAKKEKTPKLEPADQDEDLGGLPPGAPDDGAFLRAAMSYAVEHSKAADGIRWLKAFIAEDVKATNELEAWMGQPKGSFFDASLRTADNSEAEEGEGEDLTDL